MAQNLYPSFDIGNLNTDQLLKDLISIEPFGKYVSNNPHLQGIHTHSFFHLAFFKKGTGDHTIDFHTFPVQDGMFYVMKPGQVHNWAFSEGDAEGIIINFSPLFFDSLQISSSLLQQLPIFEADIPQRVVVFPPVMRAEVMFLMDKIMTEKTTHDTQSYLYIANTLIQLFILAGRCIAQPAAGHMRRHIHYSLFKQFEQLVETHFRQKKLPKDYAPLLHISPHQLNAICNSLAGISAGTYIRNRMVLEAKRLLVNFHLQISEIAYELEFSDPSNFGKFFKKYSGITPEQFRNQYKTA